MDKHQGRTGTAPAELLKCEESVEPGPNRTGPHQPPPYYRIPFDMKYLHTMLRVSDLNNSLAFFKDCLDMVETRRYNNEAGRFTLVFLAARDDVEQACVEQAPVVELTYNWDPEEYGGGRNFGHLAYEVDDIYATCQRLMDRGTTINRPPRDGRMAFIRTPDNISIELLQKGTALAIAEPWASMENTGEW